MLMSKSFLTALKNIFHLLAFCLQQSSFLLFIIEPARLKGNSHVILVRNFQRRKLVFHSRICVYSKIEYNLNGEGKDFKAKLIFLLLAIVF